MYKIGGFYRKKGRAKELLTTKKKGLLLDQSILWVEGKGKSFYHADCFLGVVGSGAVPVIDYFIGID